jgi:methyl coenzyme M reductase subunit C
MNATLTETQFISSEYTSIGLGALLLVSELLPLLKKHKGNGIVDTVLCILRGSSCFINKLTETLEKTKTNVEEKEVEKEIEITVV